MVGFHVSYAESSVTCSFELNTAILDFARLEVKKNRFFKSRPTDLKCCVLCYAESSVTCKFELNTAILDFDRFEVSKNPIFRSSSRRPQMVRFVLVTVKAA